MIYKECREWLSAFSERVPAAALSGLKRTFESLGRGRGGRWECGLDGGETFAEVGLRYFGEEGDFGAFHARAAKQFGFGPFASGAPADGRPWLEFSWDLAKDEPRAATLHDAAGAREKDGTRLSFHLSPLDRKFLSEPALREVFADLAGLCAPRGVVSVWEEAKAGRRARPDWSLRLAEGVPWPDFARLTLAAPFAGRAALFAVLLLDRRVSEAAFSASTLRVYCGA